MRQAHQFVLAAMAMTAACTFAGAPAAFAAGPCSPGQHLAQRNSDQNPPGSFKVAGQNGGSARLADSGGGSGGSDRRVIEQADSGGGNGGSDRAAVQQADSGGGNGGSDRRSVEMASAACQ